jgi:hypothetical protein
MDPTAWLTAHLDDCILMPATTAVEQTTYQQRVL